MWKRGRARGEEERIGGQWREGGRVIRGGGEQRERGQGFYDVWEGEVTFPLTFILAFFPPRALLPHTQKHTNILTVSRTHSSMQVHMHLHIYSSAYSLLSNRHTHIHTSLSVFQPLFVLFSPLCRSPCNLASLSSSQSWKLWTESRRNSNSSRLSITGTQNTLHKSICACVQIHKFI